MQSIRTCESVVLNNRVYPLRCPHSTCGNNTSGIKVEVRLRHPACDYDQQSIVWRISGWSAGQDVVVILSVAKACPSRGTISDNGKQMWA